MLAYMPASVISITDGLLFLYKDVVLKYVDPRLLAEV